MSQMSDVLTPASTQIKDVTNIAWPLSSLLTYLNMAIREIITIKPEAYTQTVSRALVAGARQELESDDIQLIDITYNLGVGGKTRSSAVRTVPRETMDYLVPDWPSFPTGQTVVFAIVDERDPFNYFVFPPQPSPAPGQQVEMLVSQFPPAAGQAGDNFPLDDSYLTMVMDYVVARALIEENNVPGTLQKGQWYMQQFYQKLGLKGAELQKAVQEQTGGEVQSAPQG